MTIAIEVKNLRVAFQHGRKSHIALDDISFKVPSGKTVGFIGPNGAGKTTTLHVLLGFTEPDSGTATLFGENAQSTSARNRIGYLSEHPESYKFMTGFEYMKLTANLFGIKGEQQKERISTLLEEVELTEHAHKKIGTYSRGMLQRIGLAQALINDPELLILDEPTNGLDPIGRLKIRQLIEQLKARGKTIFFSSHELSEIETVCDEIIMIANGKIIQQGPVAELIGDKRNLEHYFLEALQTQSEGV
ncbi:MAG: ABC transporter ATP-binding protein [Pontiella sp.]